MSPMRLRKLIGTFLLLGFIVIYALIAMAIGAGVLQNASGLTEFLYYLIAGLLWVPPAGLIISWMQRPG